jgi:hydrogenase-4 component F
MSGVLLAVALYAVIRWEIVVKAAVGEKFTDDLFIAMGLLSLTIGAFSLVIQRNYKRMLAYSSIEHMGLICIGLALGPLGTFAAMLHLLNHALAKSTTFLLAGRVLQRYRTTEIKGVSGLLRTMPWTGGLFAAGVLAVIGLPPFGLFMSEFALFRAGFAVGHPWLMGLVLALLTVAFISMIGHLNRMLYGPPTEGVTVGERYSWALVPLGLCVAALVVLGITLPGPVQILLTKVVEIAGR